MKIKKTRRERTERNLQLLDELLVERGPFTFCFYYGEKKTGYLRQDEHDNFYIIKDNSLDSKLNNSSSEERTKILNDNGFKIIPETLLFENFLIEKKIKQRPIESQSNSNNYFDTNNIRKLVIIGAGASFNFSPNAEEEFPLTNQIFSDENYKYLKHFPGARYYIDVLNEKTNLEDFFEKEWKRVVSSYDINTLRKIINTQFFLHYLFYKKSKINEKSKKSYYKTLVNYLGEYCQEKDEKIALVSFNYDLMLEKAIEHRYNLKFNTIDSYIKNHSDFLLFKPHGSCNWARKFNANNTDVSRDIIYTANWAYENDIDLHEINMQLQNEVVCLPDLYEFNDNILAPSPPNYLYYPELLIPYSKKDNFVMPQWQTDSLNKILPTIDEILVIGWKGTEEKFNNMLKTRLGSKSFKIKFFTHDDKNIVENLSPYLPKAEFLYKDYIHGNNTNGDFKDLASLIINHQFSFNIG